MAHRPAGQSESSNRVLRRGTVNSMGKLSRPSLRRVVRPRVYTSVSGQKWKTLRVSRGTERSQRSPSHSVDEPRQAVSAVISISARRHRDQPSHPSAVISRKKISPLFYFEFCAFSLMRSSEIEDRRIKELLGVDGRIARTWRLQEYTG